MDVDAIFKKLFYYTWLIVLKMNKFMLCRYVLYICLSGMSVSAHINAY